MIEMRYVEAVARALREEMNRDERVFIMGEDVGAYGSAYGVTRGFLEEFGEKRIRDTPISESAILSGAAGAALAGLRPIAEIMTINFSLVAFDSVANTMAKAHYMFGGQMSMPMVMRTTSGGRRLAATHSQSLEVIYAFFPGLKVVSPATAMDACGLLKSAIRDPDPVIFIEHALLYRQRGPVPKEEFLVPLGVSNVVREGTDLTIVSYSRMVSESIKAAEELEKQGISCEVVDLRTLRPLDMNPVYESVKKTNRLLVATEDWKSYGIGAEVAARAAEDVLDYLDAPIARVAAPEVPMPYAENLEDLAMPRARDVVQGALEMFSKKQLARMQA